MCRPGTSLSVTVAPVNVWPQSAAWGTRTSTTLRLRDGDPRTSWTRVHVNHACISARCHMFRFFFIQEIKKNKIYGMWRSKLQIIFLALKYLKFNQIYITIPIKYY